MNLEGNSHTMENGRENSTVELAAFTYHDRWGVLPDLNACLDECGGWVLEQRANSATSMEFRIELQLESILDLYGALMGTGIELTCNAHAMLTDLCTCRKNAEHLHTEGDTVVLRLVLHFREQLTVAMLLATGSAAA